MTIVASINLILRCCEMNLQRMILCSKNLEINMATNDGVVKIGKETLLLRYQATNCFVTKEYR